MIRVVRGVTWGTGSGEAELDGILRSVDSDLEALTPAERRLGAEAGERALAPLRAMGSMPVGGAIVTPGGQIPAAIMIHVVIRAPDEPVSEAGVGRAFLNGLRHAAEWDIERLGVLPLGTGAGNLDAEASARVMLGVLAEHRRENALPRDLVVLTATPYEEEVFTREAARLFPADAAAPGAPDAPSGSEPGDGG